MQRTSSLKRKENSSSEQSSIAAKKQKRHNLESDLLENVRLSDVAKFDENLSLFFNLIETPSLADSSSTEIKKIFMDISKSAFFKLIVERRAHSMMNSTLNALIKMKVSSLPYGSLIAENKDSPLTLASAKSAMARALIHQITADNHETMTTFIAAFIEHFQVLLNATNHFWGESTGGKNSSNLDIISELCRSESVAYLYGNPMPYRKIFATDSYSNLEYRIKFTLNTLIKHNEAIPPFEPAILVLGLCETALQQFELIQLLFDTSRRPTILDITQLQNVLLADTVNLLKEKGYTLPLEACALPALSAWGQFAVYSARVSQDDPDTNHIDHLIATLNTLVTTPLPTFTLEYQQLIEFLIKRINQPTLDQRIELIEGFKKLAYAHPSAASLDFFQRMLDLETKTKHTSKQLALYYTKLILLLFHQSPVLDIECKLLAHIQKQSKHSSAGILKVLFDHVRIFYNVGSTPTLVLNFLLQQKATTHTIIQDFILENLKSDAGLSRCHKLITSLKENHYDLMQFNEDNMTLLETCLVRIASDPNKYTVNAAAWLFIRLDDTIPLNPSHLFRFKDQDYTVLRLINEEPSLSRARAHLLDKPHHREILQRDLNKARIRALAQKQPKPMHQNEQSTHSAGIHKSVSESAQKLLNRYYPGRTPDKISRAEIIDQLDSYFKNPIITDIKNEYRKRLEKKYLANAAIPNHVALEIIKEHEHDFNFIDLSLIDENACERIADYHLYKAIRFFFYCFRAFLHHSDPSSKISLNLAFVLILKAINDDSIFKPEDQKHHFNVFVNRLVELSLEYGEEDPSCFGGVFNIMEFLDRIHPDVNIVRLSGENIIYFIRHFFEACFEKLPLLERNQLAANAQQLNGLPLDFVAANKAAFYGSIAFEINGGYIEKELVDAWFDALTTQPVLFQFPAIQHYVPPVSSPGPLGLFGAAPQPNDVQVVDAMEIDLGHL